MKINASFKLITTLICLSLIVPSCKKSSDDNPSVETPSNSNKLSIINMDGSPFISVEYNSSGKVSKIITAPGSTNPLVRSFEYNGAAVTIKYSGASLGNTDTEVYTIGSNSFASRMIATDTSGLKDTTDYEYDTNGYLITETTRTHVYSYSISGENIISETKSSTGSVTQYEYYSDKINPTSFDYPFPSVQNIAGLLGKASKNLLKKTSNSAYIDDISYEFDSEGNVTKSTIAEKHISTNNTNTHTFTFIYK